MQDPAGLFTFEHGASDVPDGLHLIAGLTGFADAGGAVSQFSDYLLSQVEHVPVATFDVDVLLDYRARRPIIYFDQDHLSDYRPATLQLYLAYDELHHPFLLLTGFEPDFQWERFVSAVMDLMERFQVRSTTWLNSIPMPVPHTRPIGVTVSGNRMDLIDALSVWKPQTQVPATVLHLLEYRLFEQEESVAGFVLLIPHYLADTEYPNAAVAALDCVSSATGLIFATDQLRQLGREFTAKIDEQISSNVELARLVGTLEERHDTYMEGTNLKSPLTDESGELPTADEIAAELEKFLATRRHREGDAPGA